MGLQRYRDCVLMHRGHSLYESEVHPSVVSAFMGNTYRGRSYFMHPASYAEWIEKTGMDMLYAYVPWPLGRQSTVDKWGVVNWQNGFFTEHDLVKHAPYETLRRRLDGICAAKKDWGIEWAVYSAPMILIDAMDMEKFMFLMCDEPVKMTDRLNRIHEKVCLELEIIMEYPVDVVQISQLLGDKNGQICNDEQMERYQFRYLAEHIQHIRARGKIATLHCDGKLDKLYPRFVEMGIQIINGYDSTKFSDDLKKWGNQIAMRGSISMNALYTMTPGEMRLEVQKAKALPSHVVGSTHNFPEVNPALFAAMVDEFNR